MEAEKKRPYESELENKRRDSAPITNSVPHIFFKKGKKKLYAQVCTARYQETPFLLPTLLSNSYFCSCVAGMERD